MARTEVYTCDICKQSKSKGDLASINVRSEGIRIKSGGYGGIQIDVCQECLNKKGFVVEVKETREEDDQVLMRNENNLRDKIYDFLSDMGVVFEE